MTTAKNRRGEPRARQLRDSLTPDDEELGYVETKVRALARRRQVPAETLLALVHALIQSEAHRRTFLPPRDLAPTWLRHDPPEDRRGTWTIRAAWPDPLTGPFHHPLTVSYEWRGGNAVPTDVEEAPMRLVLHPVPRLELELTTATAAEPAAVPRLLRQALKRPEDGLRVEGPRPVRCLDADDGGSLTVVYELIRESLMVWAAGPHSNHTIRRAQARMRADDPERLDPGSIASCALGAAGLDPDETLAAWLELHRTEAPRPGHIEDDRLEIVDVDGEMVAAGIRPADAATFIVLAAGPAGRFHPRQPDRTAAAQRGWSIRRELAEIRDPAS